LQYTTLTAYNTQIKISGQDITLTRYAGKQIRGYGRKENSAGEAIDKIQASQEMKDIRKKQAELIPGGSAAADLDTEKRERFKKSVYRAKTKVGIIRNILNARKVSKELWKKGYAVICPHSNTALFDGICPDKWFLDGDLEILAKCDLLVLVKGWIHSTGTQNEVKYAKSLNIPVHIWDYSINDFVPME
jgi:hypothetical protein